ncbi:glycoside hydrolase family 19 protein [Vulcaniibacterium tengchongense]|uniref:Putative chitinase n=1 Tax=Vulcaniibacterium tengchongense TaxID=1273429 RepID=A0A3N4V4F5_9GAMM|nr:glycoside hydrolase family 19 protein [Vulcaniibacterium tengchongense]RPE74621.1 putative chitinase [Vulcaniibacterium tengchongense]
MVTDDQLAQIMRCPLVRAQRWRPALTAAMARFGITTARRAAHFLAQVGHESLSLSRTEEDLSYSLPRLLEVFGHRIPAKSAGEFVRQPEKLGNYVYARRNGNGDIASGDGYRYRGRGPMMHTGRGNYRRVGQLIGAPLEQQPTLLLDVETGAQAAAAYWRDSGLNAMADAGDVLMVSRRINLGSATSKRTPEGLQDRIARTRRALAILGAG